DLLGRAQSLIDDDAPTRVFCGSMTEFSFTHEREIIMSTKTIFITGSSTGLGRATAKLFASHGWKVIATMRSPEKETELGGVPGLTLMPLDVTKRDQIEEAVRRAVEMGPVDVLFNNAGYGLAGPLEGITDEQLVAQIDTNLLGTIRTTKAFLPH